MPKANDRWSVATYNDAREYLRQREGRVTDVLLDCVMTGDSVVSGTRYPEESVPIRLSLSLALPHPTMGLVCRFRLLPG